MDKTIKGHVAALCSQIINAPKIKKIDVYSVFRFITNKKHKVTIRPEDYDLGPLVDDLAIKEFISQVNPYFGYDDDEKFNYYKVYYQISKELVGLCDKIQSEKEVPFGYRIYDATNNIFLTFNDVDDEIFGKINNVAFYKDEHEAYKVGSCHLKLYKFLEIERRLELWVYNSQDTVLKKYEIK